MSILFLYEPEDNVHIWYYFLVYFHQLLWKTGIESYNSTSKSLFLGDSHVIIMRWLIVFYKIQLNVFTVSGCMWGILKTKVWMKTFELKLTLKFKKW